MPIASSTLLPGLPAGLTAAFSQVATLAAMQAPTQVILDGPNHRIEYFAGTADRRRKIVIVANLSRCRLDYLICDEDLSVTPPVEHCSRIEWDRWWRFFLTLVGGGYPCGPCCKPSYFNPCTCGRCCTCRQSCGC
jgi:hypothetical protein